MSELITIPRIKTDKNTLEQILKPIYTLVDETTITLSDEGLTFRGMDPHHVALIDISVPNACFEAWEIEQEIKIGFKVSEFLKIVKSLDKKLTVQLELKENQLIISQKGLEIQLRLIEAGSTDTPLPKIPYDASFEVNTQNFKQVLKNVGSVSDYITIEADHEVRFSGKGDVGEVKTAFERFNQLIDLNVRQESKGTYSLEYLDPFCKSQPVKSNIMVEYSTDKPVRLEAKINNIGRVHFYLAPRIEN